MITLFGRKEMSSSQIIDVKNPRLMVD